jgi:hypothetical protein
MARPGGRSLPAAEAESATTRDITELAARIEEEFDLAHAPSLGLTIVDAPEPDQPQGPGGPALLVRDPPQYLQNTHLPTSPLDREVDYWISDEEGDLMYERLHSPEETSPQLAHLPLLARVCKSQYEDLTILPSEVAALKEESRRLAATAPDLKAAMVRIARVCDLALKDGLGIIVLGR